MSSLSVEVVLFCCTPLLRSSHALLSHTPACCLLPCSWERHTKLAWVWCSSRRFSQSHNLQSRVLKGTATAALPVTCCLLFSPVDCPYF
ncbi:hypothetical protein DFP73DRAFT_52186 [Morchella snyderi]|nr:hypothetical protein DFP73DRAFT_52186 [Morchella snyderi]